MIEDKVSAIEIVLGGMGSTLYEFRFKNSDHIIGTKNYILKEDTDGKVNVIEPIKSFIKGDGKLNYNFNERVELFYNYTTLRARHIEAIVKELFPRISKVKKIMAKGDFTVIGYDDYSRKCEGKMLYATINKDREVKIRWY